VSYAYILSQQAKQNPNGEDASKDTPLAIWNKDRAAVAEWLKTQGLKKTP
jgi:hypothetical protein